MQPVEPAKSAKSAPRTARDPAHEPVRGAARESGSGSAHEPARDRAREPVPGRSPRSARRPLTAVTGAPPADGAPSSVNGGPPSPVNGGPPASVHGGGVASSPPAPDWAAGVASLRRTPQQARSRARLARVLATAERVLIREGVEALTTTRVAAEAGVSVGSLYQYLPDRDAIIEALAAGYFARLERAMDDLVEAAAEERWTDPVGVLIDAFAALYRAEHGFRALWFGTGLTERIRAADRAHKRRMADGVRRVLLVLGLAEDDAALSRACHAAMLTADALSQEAFRRTPSGDQALLEEAKVMLRGYLSAVTGRYGPA